MNCILIGLPIWFTIGILITFSPEFAREIGLVNPIVAGDAVMFSYLGLAGGDMSSGLFSQWFRSRRKIVFIFILITLTSILVFLYPPVKSTSFFYFSCFFLGFGIGYWALFVTIAAEQFGTNLRSTVATTVPNFIRGTVVPLTIAFKYLRDEIGIITGAVVVGVVTISIALLALRSLKETFGKDLDFVEDD
jgi:MFS family permease